MDDRHFYRDIPSEAATSIRRDTAPAIGAEVETMRLATSAAASSGKYARTNAA
jgi:hypothetical protein